ncbi:alpha/beta hydrolase [Phanerochaete sordida]|uniref:Alpha/beta hydrolase n=1 Tax=Phanerochaete sordida TaxID=48140 RepID=A0A9P3GQW0_9APHY|nr:alpha/beta hydrolase [Phanerochaete sordida]
MNAPQHRTVVSADGMRIYAVAAGDARRPALVCAHGFASTSFAFSKQFADRALLEKVFLVAYDARGTGRSDKPEAAAAYDGARLAEDFKAVCEAFGVVRPVVLGWSIGATVIVAVAQHLPSGYLRGMIYTGGGVLTRSIHAAYISEWIVATLPALLDSDATAAWRANVAFVDGLFARPDEVPHEVKLRWLGDIALAPPCTRVYIEASSRGLDDAKWEEMVANMRFMVIQGRLDRLVDSSKMEAVLKERFGKRLEWVTIEDAGHTPCWEKPEEHNAAVIRYIESLDT